MNWFILTGLAILALKLLPKTVSKPTPKVAAARAKRPAHEVLEVAPDATPAEIKRAYQTLIQQYHPDKVANAAPEIQALAEKRTKELNGAYDSLTKRAAS